MEPEKINIKQVLGNDIEDINKSLMQHIIKNPFIYWFLIIGLTLVAIIFLTGNITFLQPLFIIYFFIFFIFSAFTYQKIQSLFMRQVADKLGYRYNFAGNLFDVRGKLFEIGHDRKIQNVLSGKYLNIPLKIFNYCFTIGYGKHKRTYNYTIFEAQFNTNLPNIVLLAGGFSILFDTDMLPMIKGKEKLSLEGDFNKYFTLYIPNDLQIEVLEIFTPDVMVEFIDKFQGMNMEISKDKMYIYTKKIVSTKKEILLMHELVSKLSDKLNEVLCDVGQDIKEEGIII